ncbi:uncharacterized protein LOC113214207 [Frankliniella occidentalis]|uniref:Uncharacterized protein LOC113214207 n=1 Tax=Frankliniella occidentalis TaxID=133901 RepID=A0A6J1T7N2_FRAOC|nr:uncharacterized protein LOC113214207 [Frankliniella occidentalis]
MSGVFQKLQERHGGHASKRSPSDLKRGAPYVCYKFIQKPSEFKDKATDSYPDLLVAYCVDKETSNKYYVSMPGLYNNLTEDDVKELNEQIADKKPPFLVFYGKDGSRNDCVLHQYGTSVDHEKLQKYLKQEKRSSAEFESEEASTSKKKKED